MCRNALPLGLQSLRPAVQQAYLKPQEQVLREPGNLHCALPFENSRRQGQITLARPRQEDRGCDLCRKAKVSLVLELYPRGTYFLDGIVGGKED